MSVAEDAGFVAESAGIANRQPGERGASARKTVPVASITRPWLSRAISCQRPPLPSRDSAIDHSVSAGRTAWTVWTVAAAAAAPPFPIGAFPTGTEPGAAPAVATAGAGSDAASAPPAGSSANKAPSSAAADRCDQPSAGSRRGTRPLILAASSTSTPRANAAQASQPIAASTQTSNCPWSGALSNAPGPAPPNGPPPRDSASVP